MHLYLLQEFQNLQFFPQPFVSCVAFTIWTIILQNNMNKVVGDLVKTLDVVIWEKWWTTFDWEESLGYTDLMICQLNYNNSIVTSCNNVTHVRLSTTYHWCNFTTILGRTNHS